MRLHMQADSAAAIGICRRIGIDCVRHLAVWQPLVQESLRRGDVTLLKVNSEDNPADVLTKHVTRVVLDKHLWAMSLKRAAGRAATALWAKLA